MQSFGIRAALLSGSVMVAMAASNASAVVLFNSHGFEPSANPTINYVPNTSLVGQPSAGLPQNAWGGTVQAGANLNTPLSGVFGYSLPTGGNLQYALVQAPNINSNSYGYFYPKTNLAVVDGGFGNYTPLPNELVAVTFSMNVYSGYAATAANSMLYGVSAFNGGSNEIGTLGINNFNGSLVLPSGSTTYNGGFTAPLDTFVGYELLLNYATQTWSIFTEPLSGPGAFTYTLRASGGFANASTNFSDADLAAFPLSTGNGSGYAAFDDYLVQTVPEPTCLTAGGLALGLLASRRRRAV